MVKVLSLLLSSMAIAFGIPVGHNSDDSVLSGMNFGGIAKQIVTIEHNSGQSLSTSNPKPIHSSHLIEASKDLSAGAVLIPLQTKAEAGAIAGGITAAAALKGSVLGSAIATPIILKAVAFPGLAAGATAAVMSVPKLITDNMKHFPQMVFNNVKTSVEDSAHNFANLLIVDKADDFEPENDTTLDLNKGMENMAQTVELIKGGALGMATKGLVAAKKGARVAGRVIFKPIAILTGVHLKMLGSGLAFGGKLIGGTGAGIAKAGTVVKYTGLGSIGLGASAIAWGLDKSTIDTHFSESDKKFKLI